MAKRFGRSLNKRGSVVDLLWIPGVLLILAISFLIGFFVMSNLNDKVQTMDAITAKGKAASTELTDTFTGAIDTNFLMLAVFLSIGALILAALVRIHPIFIPLFIIMYVFILFFCGVMSNIYTEMAGHANLIAYADQLTMITFIMTYLPLFIGIVGILLMIVQYKTWKSLNV